MSNRNEVLKKRYEVYRKLGYDSATSRALSQRSLDVSSLEISKKTGKLKQNKKTKTFINNTMQYWKRKESIDNHKDKMSKIAYDDTNYTPHGVRTRDKRYKGETGKIVSIIRHENKLSRDQAYYFYYMMFQGKGMSYEETKKQLLSRRDFEQNMSGKNTLVQQETANKLRKNAGLEPLVFEKTVNTHSMKEQRLNAHKRYMKK